MYKVTQISGKGYILRKETVQMCAELPILHHVQLCSKEVERFLKDVMGKEGKTAKLPRIFCVPACDPIYVSDNPEGR